MTTTYDTEFTTETLAAVRYDDANTYTVAEAWSSSPLGELDGVITADFTAPEAEDESDSVAARAKLFAALAAGVIGGATLGAVLFGWAEPAKPVLIVPDSGVSTSPLPTAAPAPGGAPVQAPVSVKVPAPAPTPVAAEPKPAETIVPTPAAAVDPGTPPVSAPPVVVDVNIPPLPPMGEKPEPAAPGAPKPQPPTFDPPNIDVLQIPQLDPADPPKPQRVENLAPITKPDSDGEPERNVNNRFNSIAKP